MLIFLKLYNYIINFSTIKIWTLVLFYISICALLIQFVILPIFLSESHWGGGFLKEKDAITYHRISSEVSARIDVEGFSAWSIKPQSKEYAISGITSGVNGLVSLVYNLTTPKLWAMIPVNAVIHATSSILLLNILLLLGFRRSWSIIALIPFIFFPSSAQWWSQLGKDGIFILGFF